MPRPRLYANRGVLAGRPSLRQVATFRPAPRSYTPSTRQNMERVMDPRAADISRRTFFDRAGKLALGGLTTAAVVNPFGATEAAAQQPAARRATPRRRPQRVALVGADHYHA